ncbi:MAG: class I SAM-dependent methyltransferase [Reyranellaceae bacterium]
MSDDRRRHWDTVYQTKATTSVSWYQPVAEPSLAALDGFRVPHTAGLIDIGGGASPLVDNLVERGWTDLTVLDIAEPALAIARQRLAKAGERVRWICADITSWMPDRLYDVWHDRAVLHFLTEAAQRQHYRQALEAALRPGGLAIIATFALDGPERCSGLPVRRYDADLLAQELGDGFELLKSWRQSHATPGGANQSFNWCAFRRR